MHVKTRRLAAIMFTDIVGFSRQMGADEARTMRLLNVHNRLIHQAVSEHHGHVIKTIGDAFLVDFPSVVHAVQCAQAIHAQLRVHNAEQEQSEQIHVRIGIHLGDILQQEGDVFGDGVNIAARLQSLAEPDTICISQKVYEEVAKKINLGTVVSLGKPPLKNIAERFAVYALLPESSKGIRQTLQVQRLHLSRRLRPVHYVGAVGLLLMAGTFIVTRSFLTPPLNTQHVARTTQESLPLPDKPSIAILPFDNISNDPSQDYFSDGITEDITTDLSKIASLFVISRNSAFTYKGKAVKVQEVSKELGVHYVLEGGVRRSENQVRITAQLIDATQGQHLWSERYDRPLQDIFALQDEVIRKIVTSLELKLTVGEQLNLTRFPTNDMAAYDYFLRGTENYYRFRQETNAEARQLFTRALEHDPQYTAAYALIGYTYWTDWYSQWTPDPKALERAFQAAQKAMTLDDSLSAAHQIASIVYLWQRRYEQAFVEAERAVAANPNEATAYWTKGFVLNFIQKYQEALQAVETAIRLNPHSPPYYLLELGKAYRFLGQPEKAIIAQKAALARNPTFLPARLQLAGVYSELGQEKEAEAEVTQIMQLSPNFSLATHQQSVPYKEPSVLERYIDSLRKAGLK